MTTPAITIPIDERELYPLHEEDDVPEINFHKVQTTDLYNALKNHFRDRFVGGNICIDWEPNNTRDYRAPDVFIADGFPAVPDPRVYLLWRDAPILLAIEIGSRSTFRLDEGPKVQIYEQRVQARAYLYANPPVGELRLWQRGAAGYEEASPEPNGRMRVADLGLEFGIEDGYLRIYTLDGTRLPTHEEAMAVVAKEARQRQEAEARAQAAETRAAAEARQRQEADRRTQEAEARVAEERARREAIEQELAALRARMEASGETNP